MKENVLYVKLDENKVITGFFKCFSTKPKYKAIGCEFAKSDIENAKILDAEVLEASGYRKVDYYDIIVGKSTYSNGIFTKNEEV